MTARKWSVRKRDGVWAVIDHRGRLRYAANQWEQAVTFALLRGEPEPVAVVEPMVWPYYQLNDEDFQRRVQRIKEMFDRARRQIYGLDDDE